MHFGSTVYNEQWCDDVFHKILFKTVNHDIHVLKKKSSKVGDFKLKGANFQSVLSRILIITALKTRIKQTSKILS